MATIDELARQGLIKLTGSSDPSSFEVWENPDQMTDFSDPQLGVGAGMIAPGTPTNQIGAEQSVDAATPVTTGNAGNAGNSGGGFSVAGAVGPEARQAAILANQAAAMQPATLKKADTSGIEQTYNAYDQMLQREQMKAQAQQVAAEKEAIRARQAQFDAQDEVKRRKMEAKLLYASPEDARIHKSLRGEIQKARMELKQMQDPSPMARGMGTNDPDADLLLEGDPSQQDVNTLRRRFSPDEIKQKELHIQKLQAKQEELEARTSDPNNIESDTFKPLGMKLLAALAAGLAGFGAGLQGRSDNTVLNMIDGIIDRDINLKLKRGEQRKAALAGAESAAKDSTTEYNLLKSAALERASDFIKLQASRIQNTQQKQQAMNAAEQLSLQAQQLEEVSINNTAQRKISAAGVLENLAQQKLSFQLQYAKSQEGKLEKGDAPFQTYFKITNPAVYKQNATNEERVKLITKNIDGKIAISELQNRLAKKFEEHPELFSMWAQAMSRFNSATDMREKEAAFAQLFAYGREESGSGAALLGPEEADIRAFAGAYEGFAQAFANPKIFRKLAQNNFQHAQKYARSIGGEIDSSPQFMQSLGFDTVKVTK